MKASNPKGRLWEECARRQLAAPRVQHEARGGRHRVEMRLDVDEWELTSGVQWGWSRKVAEQLAARAILDELAALERDELAVRQRGARPSPAARAEAIAGDDDVFDVDEGDAERLRRASPKSQVMEWCQGQRPPVRRPRFEARPVGRRTLVRARLMTLGLESPWFRARRRKDGEQAAAEALLTLLEDGVGAADDVGEILDAVATANPRTLLNEMVQRGELSRCHIEVVGVEGPAHAPRFTAFGSASFPGEQAHEVEVGGATKRQAIQGAARALLSWVTERTVSVR